MKSSGIITLLTDFGLADPYAAIMKGVILSINPKACLVDITHVLKPGAIFPAARIIREAYAFFPAGTVHLGVVDPGVGSNRRMIAVEADGHAFVGPDNGLFWLVLQKAKGARVVRLTEKRFFMPSVSRTFQGRDVFAPVAAHLSLGEELEPMGRPITDPTPLFVPMPNVKGDVLHGQIIHMDRFGNLISNIDADLLYRFLGPSCPLIQLGSISITKLDRVYSDVEEGRLLALINSSDLLEIAVNLGRASEYAGVEKEDLIGSLITVAKI